MTDIPDHIRIWLRDNNMVAINADHIGVLEDDKVISKMLIKSCANPVEPRRNVIKTIGVGMGRYLQEEGRIEFTEEEDDTTVLVTGRLLVLDPIIYKELTGR
jgi:hypothetical protein